MPGLLFDVGLSISDLALRTRVAGWLAAAGYRYVDQMEGCRARVAIVLHSPETGADGFRAVKRLRAEDRQLPVIFAVRTGCEQTAIEALRTGVTDYLHEPLERDALLRSIAGCLTPVESSLTQEIVGLSRQTADLREEIRRVAAARCGVLITGETGTGKELTAQLIHRLSPRSERPFVCLNCAALPDTLMESELFGHERGAFTGAATSYPGKLHAANGGTVLLDEIGELSLAGQAKLLRTIESGEIFRLGATRSVQVDVRVVASTNRDLETMAREGRFRLDLFYRLNVARIRLAPLRERPEDIPALVAHYMAILARQFGALFDGVSSEAMALLKAHVWPGNVRELRNVLESVFVHARGSVVQASDLPFHTKIPARSEAGESEELTRIKSALEVTHWNVTRAADLLHLSRMTVYRKLVRYGLDREKPVRLAQSA